MTQDEQRARLAEVLKHEVRRYPAESDLLRLRAEVEEAPPEREAEIAEAVQAMPYRFCLLHIKALGPLLPLLSEAERSHVRQALERLALPPQAA